MEQGMELIKDFMSKKWAKWVIAGVVALIIIMIFPRILLVLLQLLIAAALIFFAYKMLAPKRQKAADDVVYTQYCDSLNANEMRNLIISGGNSYDRFSAIARILNEASRKRIPTIVLHSGFSHFSQFSQNTFYDPCVGKDSDEIAEILTDASANALDTDRVIQTSLKFIADLLQTKKGGDITLADIVKFPCDDVLSYLDSLKDDNAITDSQYDKFKQRYNNPAVKDNIYKVASLLSKLKPLAQNSDSAQAVNFQQAVTNRQILFFDMLTDTNHVLKELVFADITKLTEISKFWVVTEGISFIGKQDSKVDSIFTRNRNNITLIYSGDDVPTLTAQTGNVFDTLTGGNSQFLLFAHSSESSAKKWSERFGEENKTKVTTGSNRGLVFHTGSNTNVSTEKDYKFPPQHFRKLAKTVNINNRAVYWGLNDGECYFIQDESAILETKEKSSSTLLRILGLAGQTEHDMYLPKIALNPTPLAIEGKVS